MKKVNLSDEDIHRITTEVIKHMKQFMDEEIEIRLRKEVKSEIQKVFRNLGRDY